MITYDKRHQNSIRKELKNKMKNKFEISFIIFITFCMLIELTLFVIILLFK